MYPTTKKKKIQNYRGNLSRALKQMYGTYVIKVAFQGSRERMGYSINCFGTITIH